MLDEKNIESEEQKKCPTCGTPAYAGHTKECPQYEEEIEEKVEVITKEAEEPQPLICLKDIGIYTQEIKGREKEKFMLLPLDDSPKGKKKLEDFGYYKTDPEINSIILEEFLRENTPTYKMLAEDKIAQFEKALFASINTIDTMIKAKEKQEKPVTKEEIRSTIQQRLKYLEKQAS